MSVGSVDVVGLKAFVEASGRATQKNGRPYNNRYCWFLFFSEDTGKMIEIHEYLNTALIKEVYENN